MSDLTGEVRRLVMERLRGSAALSALLAFDPANDTFAALWNARRQIKAPVYPCVTYRIASATPDPRHRLHRPIGPDEERNVGAGSAIFWNYRLDLEVWSDQPDIAPLDAIGSVLQELFENRSFEIAGGRIFSVEKVSDAPDNYDAAYNAWFSLYAWILRVKRTTAS